MLIKKINDIGVNQSIIVDGFNSTSTTDAGSAKNDKTINDILNAKSAITITHNAGYNVTFTGGYVSPYTTMTFGTTACQLGSGLVLSNNGVKVDSANISYIKVQGAVSIDTTYNVQCVLLKNGSGIGIFDTSGNSGMTTCPIGPIICPCAQNDVFTISFAQSSAGTQYIRGERSFLTIEQIK